ncbi:MAG: D-alanyl-D-alanine carboxypeptidase [Lachnospiraceae bacterium]|nr:D-alanyl-D-alanine carboxypeptidase [Lachnospiraceae bacterium]
MRDDDFEIFDINEQKSISDKRTDTVRRDAPNNVKEIEYDDISDIRKERIRQMKIEKEKQLRRRALIKKYWKFAAAGLGILAFAITAGVVVNTIKKNMPESSDKENTVIIVEAESETAASDTEDETENNIIPEMTEVISQSTDVVKENKIYSAQITDNTDGISDEIISERVVFIDKATGNILAQKGYKDVISPASMTKVLSVLVAAEQLGINSNEDKKLDDKFEITIDITDYSYVNDCSNVGFDVGEKVTVRDLFYGTILPSGADAAMGLAIYTAGSHEAFVELMNKKVEELGLSQTAHFTNCVGLYDEQHHCTVYDMAMIMEAALDNPFCREVLAAHVYTTAITQQHPEGLVLSNWFLRRIEDKDTGGEVLCAKTGFVVQSKNCAVSFGKDNSGNEYVCCTAGSSSSWRCIYDHVELYKKYAK